MPWQAGKSGNPATQFRPGRSGNPRGRPPVPSVTPRLRKLLERDADGRTVADRLAELLVSRAASGDYRAIQIVLDRTEGKVSARGAGPAQAPGEAAGRVVIVEDRRGGGPPGSACDGPTDEV